MITVNNGNGGYGRPSYIRLVVHDIVRAANVECFRFLKGSTNDFVVSTVLEIFSK